VQILGPTAEARPAEERGVLVGSVFRRKVNVDIRVVSDVSGEHFVDHEKEVLAYLARD
jgi:hypothetical protein